MRSFAVNKLKLLDDQIRENRLKSLLQNLTLLQWLQSL